MSDETIIIKTVTEKVKVSELNERDFIIWNHGYEKGINDKRGIRNTIPALVSVIIFLIMILSFSMCGQ